MIELKEIIFSNESQDDDVFFGYRYIAAAHDLSQNTEHYMDWRSEHYPRIYLREKLNFETCTLKKTIVP